MRVIYAEEAKKALIGAETELTDEDIEFIIDQLHTVDAEPVKHSHWIYFRGLNGMKQCKCAECLTSYGNMDTPYCPNCGAKMDKERTHEKGN